MTDTLEIRGTVAPGFEGVRDTLAELLAARAESACQVAANLDGRTIVDLWCGETQYVENAPGPVAKTTLIPVYSVTKAITALVVAKLIDAGLIDYDERIADTWPAFAAHGKDQLTLAQAMSHQAGLPGVPDSWDPADWYDWEKTTARLAALTPMWEPGSRSGYHPFSWGFIIDNAVRAKTGRSVSDHLRAHYADPFDLDVWIGLPDGETPRAAHPRKPPAPPDLGEINEATKLAFLTPWASPRNARDDAAQWLRAQIPSANGHATALGVARLFQPLARAGMLDDVQVLAPETVERATQERIAGPDQVLPYDISWAAGLIRNTQSPPRHYYGPGARSVGHTGFGGSCAFADPDAGLSFAYATLRLSPALVEDARAQALMAAIYDAL